MKTFRKDLETFENFLINKDPFTFSKFADGELSILQGHHIDITFKANGEFKYIPNSDDEFYRQKLIESIKFKHKNYYVGIGCPCCIGTDSFNYMKLLSEQDEDKLTWANLWVNSNYEYYKSNIVPLYNLYDVIMVINHKATLYNLPFNVVQDFRVGTNAWKDDYHIVEKIKNYITLNKVQNNLFLFCAGPFGNILAHQLTEFEPNNTYLDIGSTIDPMLFGHNGYTRVYLSGGPDLHKTCIWG